MNNQSYRTKTAVIVLLLSVLLAACGAGGKGAPNASSVLYSDAAAAAPSNRVALESLAGQSLGETRSLTMVYQDPDTRSSVVDVIVPAQSLNILGRSAESKMFAVASVINGQKAVGWVSTADVRVAEVVGETRSLTMVYQEPDTRSSVVDVIIPAQRLSILGRSTEGNMFAVTRVINGQKAVGWVSAVDVKIPGPSAETYSLTKVHLKPTLDSSIVNVLVPTQKVILLGRNAGGDWVAIASVRDNGASGWVPTSDVKFNSDVSKLPVFQTR